MEIKPWIVFRTGGKSSNIFWDFDTIEEARDFRLDKINEDIKNKFEGNEDKYYKKSHKDHYFLHSKEECKTILTEDFKKQIGLNL